MLSPTEFLASVPRRFGNVLFFMNKFIIVLGFAFLAAFTVSAQTPTPTVTPTPPVAVDDDVVKISTNLIQLDVTVTDLKGNIVKDLKPEDFEIYENGQRQKVTGLAFVSNVNERIEKDAAKPSKTDPTAVPPPVAELRPDQIRRSVALVVDDLALSFESAHFVRRALKKFVDEQMRDGDLVAIIRTGAGIGALQQFTSDKRILYAAIEKVVWNPMGRAGIGAFAPIRDGEKMPTDGLTDEQIKERQDSENAREDFRTSTFTSGTFGALRYIVNGMSQLPGRKSVILFSDGFSLVERDEQGFTQASRLIDSLKLLIDNANRASVVFYTIDARGLQTAGFNADDDIRSETPGQLQERLQEVSSQRRGELFDTQSGLSYLARETGGFAILNNNDLAGGVRRVLEDQSYYLIGYEPDDETFDPKTRRYNKIEIKVPNRKVKVRYRSGFFNVVDRKIDTAASKAAKTPAEQVNEALTSPFAVSDIALRLNTLFGSGIKGAYIRAILHIDTKGMTFVDEPDGSKKAVFQILAVTFGDNGVPIDEKIEAYTAKIKAGEFDRVRSNGFLYNILLPVKKPGAYQFRVVVRDATAGKVGSASQFIDVPNLKKSRLTLSGIVLQNLSLDQWQRLSGSPTSPTQPASENESSPNTYGDTSQRRFQRGTVLRYGFEVYNSRLDGSKKPALSTRVRVYRDGKLLLDGRDQAVDVSGQTDAERWKVSGAVSLAKQMEAGDYILQVIVTDALAKEKQRIATQFVQFQVVD